MEHQKLDSLKALLLVLQDAGVSKYEEGPDGFRVIEFRQPTPVATPFKMPTVQKDPVDAQLAEKRPDYAKLFPQGFPKHTPPKEQPPTE